MSWPRREPMSNKGSVEDKKKILTISDSKSAPANSEMSQLWTVVDIQGVVEDGSLPLPCDLGDSFTLPLGMSSYSPFRWFDTSHGTPWLLSLILLLLSLVSFLFWSRNLFDSTIVRHPAARASYVWKMYTALLKSYNRLIDDNRMDFK